MVVIRFGEWLPDLPDFENEGATEAKNVIPAARGYRPLRSLNTYSSALDGRCRGAVSASDKNAANYTFAGSGDRLYRLVDTVMTDASKAGGYSLGVSAGWEFAIWGETVIAVSVDAPTQTISMGGTAFADLIASIRKPKAHHIGVVRDFVVLGNTFDSIDGAVPYRVWWSAIDDASNFDPSATTQCDFQNLLGGGGPVQKIVGGEYGVVVQRRAIVRMSYEGSPTVFRFDEVDRNRGAISAGAVTSLGSVVFFIADDGFYAFDGSTSTPIGKGKVDATFLADLDPAHLDRISATVDPINAVVFWAYPGAGNNNGTPNKLIIFDWPSGKWARAEIETEYLFRGIAAGYSLEGLDSISGSLDALPASLDDPLWKGGALLPAAFTSAHLLAYFTGEPMDATVETGEVQMFEGKRAFVRALRPFVGGTGTITIRIGSRDRQTDPVSWGPGTGLNALGNAEMRASARYQRARVVISGGFDHAIGIDAEVRPEGVR